MNTLSKTSYARAAHLQLPKVSNFSAVTITIGERTRRICENFVACVS